MAHSPAPSKVGSPNSQIWIAETASDGLYKGSHLRCVKCSLFSIPLPLHDQIPSSRVEGNTQAERDTRKGFRDCRMKIRAVGLFMTFALAHEEPIQASQGHSSRTWSAFSSVMRKALTWAHSAGAAVIVL